MWNGRDINRLKLLIHFPMAVAIEHVTAATLKGAAAAVSFSATVIIIILILQLSVRPCVSPERSTEAI